jgi:vancomycin resistance protein YoaR
VAGIDVGGSSEVELKAKLRRLRADRALQEISIVRPAQGGADPVRLTARRDELGFRLDVDATARWVLERGRQGNPFAALADHIRATLGSIRVDVEAELHRGDLISWSHDAAEELSVDPYPGGIRFKGTEPDPVYPRAGVVVEPSTLRERALVALATPGGERITVRGGEEEPPTARSDVDELVARARRAVSGTVRLQRNDEVLQLTPHDLSELLRTRLQGEQLRLRIAPGRLEKGIEGGTDRFASTPVDASFTLGGGGVQVVPSEPGFKFSAEKAARQVLAVALSQSSATLKGDKVPADFTTKDARSLDIVEQVSTFTTYHDCCEPRAENIHRVADIVDGAVVRPGETFSLNGHVGPRTEASGFVPAPSIRDGEFVVEVGGGISQFATTFFNAIFFGGYDFLAYQPHSYYISRYPRGREATISTPAPDLKFLNDSDAGIYIDTSYTDTSITVTFYGNSKFDIEADMGEPFNERPPKERCRVNKDLERGEERVVQSGITGFDVVVRRIFTPGNRSETFTTHYDMQPRIVERRRCRG